MRHRGFAAGGGMLFLCAGLLGGQPAQENDDIYSRAARYPQAAPALGTAAPDFTLKDLEGKAIAFAELKGNRPIVLELGSYTCPACVGQSGGMEATAKKYAGKVEFLFVYCREAHPGGQSGGPSYARRALPTPQHASAEDRKKVAQLFVKDMKLDRRILIDEFGEKSLQRAYGNEANPTIVIDVDGKIALKMNWTHGETLDAFLGKFLAKGGKYDAELAKSVPVKTPGMR